LKEKINKYKIKHWNTYNWDEKGFFIGIIKKMHRIFGRSQKKSGKLLGAAQYGSREWVSLLAYICADLTVIPLMCIYTNGSRDILDSWMEDFNPEN
jgi:hypothetical protein